MLKKIILLLNIMLISTVVTYSEKNLLLLEEDNLIKIKEKIERKEHL